MQFCASLSAVIASAFHGRGQLVCPADGADKQRHQNGHHGFGPAKQISRFKICPPGLLRGHDLIGLFNQRGNKAQGDRHHHRQFMHRHMQLLQRTEEVFNRICQCNGACGIGHQKGAHNQHGNAQHHKSSRPDTLHCHTKNPKRRNFPPRGIKHIQNCCKN